jgi:hypothetical protein
MKTEIEITGVKTHDKTKRIIGYAVCRQWRDNPKDVEVYEYADSAEQAKSIIRSLPKDRNLYEWFVGVYQ